MAKNIKTLFFLPTLVTIAFVGLFCERKLVVYINFKKKLNKSLLVTMIFFKMLTGQSLQAPLPKHPKSLFFALTVLASSLACKKFLSHDEKTLLKDLDARLKNDRLMFAKILNFEAEGSSENCELPSSLSPNEILMLKKLRDAACFFA
jgi:hypothetical protein